MNLVTDGKAIHGGFYMKLSRLVRNEENLSSLRNMIAGSVSLECLLNVHIFGDLLPLVWLRSVLLRWTPLSPFFTSPLARIY